MQPSDATVILDQAPRPPAKFGAPGQHSADFEAMSQRLGQRMDVADARASLLREAVRYEDLADHQLRMAAAQSGWTTDRYRRAAKMNKSLAFALRQEAGGGR